MNKYLMIKKLQEYLKDHKLDAFLVLTKVNRQYLSGFTGSAGVLLVTKKDVNLFVDSRYTHRAKRETKFKVSALTRIISSLKKLKRIGIEDRISLHEFQSIKKFRRGAKVIVTEDVIENIRASKTKDELNLIAKGSRIIDTAFEAIKRLVRQKRKKSLTEIEIAQLIERHGKSKGAEALAFDSIVAWGANAASPHHFASNQKIGRNNFLLLDFGMKVDRMHTDFTRTLFIGNPSKEQEKIYQTVLEAQKRAIEKIKVGVKASMIDHAARSHIKKNNFGKYFTHNTGHGVGLEIHEKPNFSQKSQDILLEGMVVTVEPGIYLPKKGGVRIEDMILVRKNPKIFSKIPKDFKNMIIP
jgi:Xaa-Pro aminopeptidase